jgi:cell division protein FtsZ
MNPPVHHDELQGNECVPAASTENGETQGNTLDLANNNSLEAINAPNPSSVEYGGDTVEYDGDTLDTDQKAVPESFSAPTQNGDNPDATKQSHQNDQSEAHEMINVYVPQPEEPQLKPCITVVGVGGAGGNAVNNMIADSLQGVDFVVANTDAQALNFARTDRRIQLGTTTTQGLGAGAKPDIGRAAAEESVETIAEQIQGANMVFITAGMGGGTGTGAAPVIARTAREMGILTVGVVTKPFQFEGAHRMRLAESGIEELSQYVDTLIIIPNQNLFRVANEKTTFGDAFRMADNVLNAGVRSITDLMIMPGLINLDFADVRTVMSDMGRAMMGTGEATGERRAIEAAEAAIANPLLEDTCMKGAKGVLINITGGPDITLFEVDEAANRIRDEVEGEAHIIFGSCFDPEMEGKMRVSVVATGINGAAAVNTIPTVNTTTHAVSSATVQQTIAPQAATAQRPAPQPVAQTVAQPRQAAAPAPRPAATQVFQQAPTRANAAPQRVQHAAPAPQPVTQQVAPQPAPRPRPMPQPVAQAAYAPAQAEALAYDQQPQQAPRPAPRPAPMPQAAAMQAPMQHAPIQAPVQQMAPVEQVYQQPESMELPEPRKAADPFIPPQASGRSDQSPLHTIPSPPPVFSNHQPRVEERSAMVETRPQQQPMPRPEPRQEPRHEGKSGGFLKGLAARLTRDSHEDASYGDDSRYEHPAAAVQEPTLSATPSDRPATSHSDEDELAIPAFLRRQAN